MSLTFQVGPKNLNASASPITRSASVGATPATVVDSNVLTTTGVSTWRDWGISSTDETSIFTNETPSIATLDEGGLLARVTDGVALVLVESGEYRTRLKCNMTQRSGQSISEFVDFISGTMSDMFYQEVMTRLVEPGVTLNYYSVINHSAPSYVRSSTCWCADVDLSGVAVATDMTNPNFSNKNRGALVTPRHILAARHWTVTYPIYSVWSGFVVGNKLRWLANDGTVHTRTVVGVAYGSNDIVVATLDSDLPETVVPLRIAGPWIEQSASIAGSTKTYYLGGMAFYLNQYGDCRVIPLGWLTQEFTSNVADQTNNGITFEDVATYGYCAGDDMCESYATDLWNSLEGFRGQAVGGDSGSPVCVIHPDGDAVLLWTWLYSSAGPPVWTTGFIDAIIADADTDAGAATGYTVTVAPDPTL